MRFFEKWIEISLYNSEKKTIDGFHQRQLSDGMEEFSIQTSILYPSFRRSNHLSSPLLIRTTRFCFELSSARCRQSCLITFLRKSSLASMASLVFLTVLNFFGESQHFPIFRECLCRSVRKNLHIFICAQKKSFVNTKMDFWGNPKTKNSF